MKNFSINLKIKPFDWLRLDAGLNVPGFYGLPVWGAWIVLGPVELSMGTGT